MKILYGYGDQWQNYIDITVKCLQNFMHKGIIHIPANDDYRATQFGDPIFGKIKNIIIHDNGITKTFTAEQDVNHIPSNIANQLSILSPNEKLEILHNKIILAGGHLNDELPEQIMAVTFIDPQDRVLELGANIGRNTLLISHILEKSSNLVTLETDWRSIYYLKVNRDINHQQFHIEHAALSLQRLIQKGWQTYTIDDMSPIPSDCFAVNIISYSDLVKKYGIQFNTLVLDCEGAFYWILKDMPDILNNIEKILMECDYSDFNQKLWIEQILKVQGFIRVYSRPCNDPVGLAKFPDCCASFYEVWERNKLF